MKIKISPSNDQTVRNPAVQYLTVTVEQPSDELSLVEALDLCTSALKAWGYCITEEDIDEVI